VTEQPGDTGKLGDMELIDRYVRGDIDGLDQLVRRHGKAVYSFIYRFLGTDPYVDDVYQDVWMRVVKSLAKFGGRSRFTTWLFQITRNICIDHLRKRKRRGNPLSIDEPSPSGGGGEEGPYRNYIKSKDDPVDEIVERRELLQHLEEAVAQLPDDQREVFLLREKTAMTFEEISAMSGVPRNTVKSRMRYALENIRRFLKTRNIGQEVTTNG
jgi:RNA polymerase sigma-70 factor, ECF subfamily